MARDIFYVYFFLYFWEVTGPTRKGEETSGMVLKAALLRLFLIITFIIILGLFILPSFF